MRSDKQKSGMKRGKGIKAVKVIALTQIFSLFLEIFAFSFILGGMVVWSSGGVSAENQIVTIDGQNYMYDGTRAHVRGNWFQSLLGKDWMPIDVSTNSGKNLQESIIDSLAESNAGISPELRNMAPVQEQKAPATPIPVKTNSIRGSGDEEAYFFSRDYNSNGLKIPAGYYTYAEGKLTPLNPQRTIVDGVAQNTPTKFITLPAGSNVLEYTGKDSFVVKVTYETFNIDEKTTKTTNLPPGTYLRFSNKKVGNVENGVLTEKTLNEEQKIAIDNIITPSNIENTITRTYTNVLGKEMTKNTPGGYLMGNILEGLSYSVWVIGFTQTLGAIMPSGKYQEAFKTLGYAAAAGIMTAKLLYGAAEAYWGKNELPPTWAKVTSYGAGFLVAYLIMAKNYKNEETREQTVSFKCYAWQAPNGGVDCDKCNTNPLKPCSEYRCKALGQSCKIINAGTGKDKCIDSNIDDVTSPGIKPDKSILTKGYAYSDVKERPPGGSGPAGMKITYNGGCLPAFTPFKFGIVTTDNGKNGVELQPAQCKIEYNHTNSFNDMDYYMGDENLYLENHSQAISLPGAKLINTTLPGVTNNGEYNIYIRCKDANGNENRDEFAVKFCIDPTPDLTAPLIKSTSIASGSAVQYKADNVSLSVYTNEPSKCKWGRKDADYSNMENNMSCNNEIWQMNAELLYTCNTILTGVKDKSENKFYFRCQDMNNNTQQQSYPFTLYGTQPLTILNVGPSGTIGSATSTAIVTLTVKTDNGFTNGNSDCYYSTTNQNSSFIKMFETGGNNHKQNLDLVDGNYIYYYRCLDSGGNLASNSTSFRVFVDTLAPIIIRTINYEGKLIIMTDENSKCKYSTTSCNFNIDSEGIDMPYQNTNTHYAEWKTDQIYYIKCSDSFENQPEPAECSMIVKPYQVTEE